MNSECFQKWESIFFPPVSTIKNVEESYHNYIFCFGHDPERVVLDLSKCNYIEVVTLLWFVSLIKRRLDSNLHTRIKLPTNKNVRDFMLVWNFPESIEKVTGIEYVNWVVKDDQFYLKENKCPADIRYSGELVDGGLQNLVSEYFFSMIVYKTKDFKNKIKTPEAESERFKTRLLMAILSKHLISSPKTIPSRIIFESLMNAIRHPDSENIVIASLYDGIKKYKSPTAKKYFTITLWDDGRSMVDTLKDALDNDKQIRVETKLPIYSNYRLKMVDYENNLKGIEYINSKITPQKGDPEEIMLLSTTFPGITRDVLGAGHKVHSELMEDNPDFTTPGMGLYVLTNAVIDFFGGELAFRCSNYFMNIKKPFRSDKYQYQVKITTYPTFCPTFTGNMLTIRLPLN